MASPFALSDVLLAGIAKLPGIWLLAGICVLLTGLLPRLTSLVWLYFGLSFFTVYIGRMMDLPAVFENVTAFGALPDYPTDAFQPAPFVIVTIVAAAFMAVGVMACARRELRYH
jgi:ABC-2 type transport system permease protein